MKLLKFSLVVALLSIIAYSCSKEENEEEEKGIYYPEDGLVSYFKFENNLSDELGNTPDGVNSNNSPYIDGVDGKAIDFNGVDQKAVFDRKTYRNGNSFSISFWFKKADTLGVRYAIECSDFIFATNDDDAILNITSTTASNKNARGVYKYGEWTHFVGTYDGNDIKAYINGELKETTNYIGEIDDTDVDLALAYRYRGSTTYWKGSFDELFIYNRVLTESEVSGMFNR